MAADRSIVARLRAEAAQFIASMAQAKKAAKSVGEGAEEGSKKADSAFVRMRKSVQDNSQHIDRLGNAALVVGGAITAGLGVGIKSFADFDAAMSQVSAALPEAGAEMDKLRQLAIDLGRDSQYSATEAAEGITELAKAGVSAQDILGGGLKGALDLAAAGELSVGEAAETAASAMTQFGLSGAQVPHIADLLAAGAGKAQGSVADLGSALNQTGLVADATGLTIEETTAGLAAFASAGLTGSDAGTSFKSMLQRLTPQSLEAKNKMKELGISAYDAQGEFIGLSAFAGNLQNALKDLTPEARNSALAVIFGSDAVRAANVLYEQGAAGITKWEGEVNSAGYAAEQAAKKTDNLKGDLERLGGAIDSVFVENGAGVNNALRGITQGAESLVEAFGNLPAGAQQTALGIAGVTGVALLAAGGFAKAVTTAADLSESLDAIRTKSPRAAKGIDVATRAAKGLSVAMVALTAAGAASGDIAQGIGVEQLTRDLLNAQDAVGALDSAYSKAAVFDNRQDSDVTSLGEALQATFNPDIVEQVDNTSGALYSMVGGENLSNIEIAKKRLTELDSALTGMVSSGSAGKASEIFQQIAAEAQKQGVSLDDLKAKFPQYAEALAAVSNQSADAAGNTKNATDEIVDLGRVAGGATDDVKDLADAIRGFGSESINADEAQDNFREAVENVTTSVKDNAKAVKDGEKTKAEAARDNREAVRGLAKAVLENSAATLEATGSAEKARAKMAEGREEFIKSAREAGYTAKQAENLADKYGLIPGNVTTVVKAQGTNAAREQVQNLIDTIRKLNSKTVTVGVRYTYSGKLPNGGRGLAGGLTADADGGMHVNGPAGLVKAYANGGMWDGSFATAQPQIRPAGGRGVLWAEDGAGPWEGFVSGHPAKRDRSRTITEDIAARLGGRVDWATPYANGGLFSRGSQASPTAAVAAFEGPVQISGVLDLGDGIRGVVRGEIRETARAAKRSR